MPSTEQIKVRVIHDDPLIREGLIAALGSYSDIEPSSFKPDRFTASLGTYEPLSGDVLVANYSNAIHLAERFTRECAARARPRILIVTASDGEWEIRNAMERGIVGYLLAGCPLDHLAIGVRAVHRGACYFSPGVSQRLAESLSADPLTGREEAVLQLVVDGLCNKAVAARLGVALGTVKTHLRAIFEKLGVETRTQAVITVARRGLLRGRTHSAIERVDASRSAGLSKKYTDQVVNRRVLSCGPLRGTLPSPYRAEMKTRHDTSH